MVVLICNSLMNYDVKHFFICLFDISVIFGKMSVQVLSSFCNHVVCFLLLSFESCLYILNDSP